jgi:hypothetical protein
MERKSSIREDNIFLNMKESFVQFIRKENNLLIFYLGELLSYLDFRDENKHLYIKFLDLLVDQFKGVIALKIEDYYSKLSASSKEDLISSKILDKCIKGFSDHINVSQISVLHLSKKIC